MASLSCTSTKNSITATITGLDGSYAYARNYAWEIYKNGSIVDSDETSTGPYATTASYTFYSLDSNTSYDIVVGVYDASWQTLFTTLRQNGVTTESGLSHLYTTINYYSDNVLQYSRDWEDDSENGYINIQLQYSISKSGYVFKGWNLDSSGSSYSNGQWIGVSASATQGGSSHRADAVWEQVPSNVWIYTGVSTNNGWQLATPYIYTSSGWKQAQAYIYTSSGWKPC